MNYFSNYYNDFLIYLLDLKKISVIIPIYNSEKYLIECLNSVINQTLKNIEIICIDDGSTDNSSNILQIYNKFDRRFILLKQKNRGAGISRNKGIKISKGKFISFLDSDDMYYDDSALEFLYNNAKKNMAIISGGGLEIKAEKGNQSFSRKLIFESDGFILYKDYQYDYYYQRFIYNKNFLKRNKLLFPNFLRYQDPPFLIRTMINSKKFYVIKRITNIYRIYRKESEQKFSLRQVIDIFSGLDESLKLAKKNKLHILYSRILNRTKGKMYKKMAQKYYNDSSFKNIINKFQDNYKVFYSSYYIN